MLITSGNTIRDEIVKNSKQLLQTTFLDDASANPYIIFWNTEIQLECRIFDRKYSQSSGVTAKVQLLIESTINVGDIIYDTVKKEYWMCTEMFNINNVHNQGKITLCNWLLKWQTTDGTMLSYPCIVINNAQRLGEEDGKFFTLGNSQRTIKLPFDEHTVLLRSTDSKKQRFFLDKHPTSPMPFKVTDNDTTTYNYGDKGLVVLKVEQDQLNLETDNVELGICDYIKPTLPPDPVDPEVPIVVVNISSDVIDDEVKLGLTYNFSTTLTDELGNLVTNAQPKYSLDTNYNGLITLIDKGDGSCSLTVKSNAYDLLTNQFTLSCTDMYSGFSSSILLTIVVLS